MEGDGGQRRILHLHAVSPGTFCCAIGQCTRRCQAETHQHHRLASPIACHHPHFSKSASNSAVFTSLHQQQLIFGLQDVGLPLRDDHCSTTASSGIARDTFHFLSIALHTPLSASKPASSRKPINLSNLNQNHHNFPVQSSFQLNTLSSFFAPRHAIWRDLRQPSGSLSHLLYHTPQVHHCFRYVDHIDASSLAHHAVSAQCPLSHLETSELAVPHHAATGPLHLQGIHHCSRDTTMLQSW